MTTTHHTLQPRVSSRTVLLAALALAFAAALAAVLYLTGTDGPAATIDTTRNAPAAEVRIGSADALDRRATTTGADVYLGDGRRYGSPDAAERSINR